MHYHPYIINKPEIQWSLISLPSTQAAPLKKNHSNWSVPKAQSADLSPSKTSLPSTMIVSISNKPEKKMTSLDRLKLRTSRRKKWWEGLNCQCLASCRWKTWRKMWGKSHFDFLFFSEFSTSFHLSNHRINYLHTINGKIIWTKLKSLLLVTALI